MECPCIEKELDEHIHVTIQVQFREPNRVSHKDYIIGAIYGMLILICDKPVMLIEQYGIEKISDNMWEMDVATTVPFLIHFLETATHYYGHRCDIRYRAYTI